MTRALQTRVMQWLRHDRAMKWPLMATTLLAFAVRVWGSTAQSLWRDEVDAIRFATRALPALLSTFRQPGENGPLFYVLLRYWLDITGQSEFAFRYLSVLLGVLAVPLTYLVARRLFRYFDHHTLAADDAAGDRTWQRAVAWLGSLGVTLSPYLVWYSQEGKMYALVVVLALGSVAALLWALTPGARHPAGRWLAYIVLTSLGFYTHVLLVLMLPVHALLFLMGWPATRRHLTGALVSLASFTLPYLPLVWWQWRLLTSPNFQPGFAFVPFGRMSAIMLAALGRGIRPVPALGFTAVWVFLILAALFLAWRRPWRRPLLALLAWLLLPPLLFYLITLQVPLFNDRYLIFIAPAFYLLAAAGLLMIAHHSRGLALAAVVIVVGLQVYGIWGQVHTPIKADWRGAAAFVQAHRSPGDIVLFQHPYNRFAYAYYAGWDYPWRETPYAPETANMTVADVGARLGQLVQGAHDVWLVESEADAWDPGGLNRQWLDSHGTPTLDTAFNLVRVTRFQLPGR